MSLSHHHHDAASYVSKSAIPSSDQSSKTYQTEEISASAVLIKASEHTQEQESGAHSPNDEDLQ